LIQLKVLPVNIGYSLKNLFLPGAAMSSSEIILYLAIWTLTGAGLFFGGRAALRRRGQRKTPRD